MEHASRIAHATGVHCPIEDPLRDLGCMIGGGIIQKERAPVAWGLLATGALRVLARLALADNLRTLAVGQCRTFMIMI